MIEQATYVPPCSANTGVQTGDDPGADNRADTGADSEADTGADTVSDSRGMKLQRNAPMVRLP